VGRSSWHGLEDAGRLISFLPGAKAAALGKDELLQVMRTCVGELQRHREEAA
jgi:hypothetical protein